jgi:hypothetical protein
MQQRRITLDDGRYLIFYTFEDEGAQAATDEPREGASAKESPKPEPQAEEERRV